MKTGSFYSNVAGVTAKNATGQSRQDCIRAYCRPGMSLILKREKDNPHDKNAVAVWIKGRAFIFFADVVQIGYLNANVAKDIAVYIDRGGKVRGEITEVTGGVREKATYGVNILLCKY